MARWHGGTGLEGAMARWDGGKGAWGRGGTAVQGHGRTGERRFWRAVVGTFGDTRAGEYGEHCQDDAVVRVFGGTGHGGTGQSVRCTEFTKKNHDEWVAAFIKPGS